MGNGVGDGGNGLPHSKKSQGSPPHPSSSTSPQPSWRESVFWLEPCISPPGLRLPSPSRPLTSTPSVTSLDSLTTLPPASLRLHSPLGFQHWAKHLPQRLLWDPTLQPVWSCTLNFLGVPPPNSGPSAIAPLSSTFPSGVSLHCLLLDSRLPPQICPPLGKPKPSFPNSNSP